MRELLRPKWIAGHILVLALVILFVNLGFWQLNRLEERQLEDTVGEARFTADVVPLKELLTTSGDDTDSLLYRRTEAGGIFRSEDEVLIRSQVYQGQAGFHVITPLMIGAGEAVLVNRGWVPLILDTVPVEQAAPPTGVTGVTGWISLTAEKGALGPADPDSGNLTALNRIDIDRIAQQLSYPLAPVVVNADEDGPESIPIAIDAPSFDDEGPHLAYAIQWFGFALIAAIGYFFLARRVVRTSV